MLGDSTSSSIVASDSISAGINTQAPTGSGSFNIPVGDWDTLVWAIILLVLTQVGIPFLQMLKTKINKDATKDDTIQFRTKIAEYMANTAHVLNSLKDVIENLKTEGQRSESEAIREMHKHFNELHLKMLVFFSKRLKEASMNSDAQRAKISNKYSMEAEEYSGKVVGYMKHFYCNGRQVSDFFAGGGAKRYCLYLMAELYNIQYIEYMDDIDDNDPYKNIDIGDIHAGLDRCLSELISQFKLFLKTGDSFLEQWDDKDPKFNIIKTIEGTIEELK